MPAKISEYNSKSDLNKQYAVHYMFIIQHKLHTGWQESIGPHYNTKYGLFGSFYAKVMNKFHIG